MKQFHISRFLRGTLQHQFVYRHTVLSSWFYYNSIVLCVKVKHYCLGSSRHSIDYSVPMYKTAFFSKTLDIAINFITPQFLPLTRGEIFTDFRTSTFMCAWKSQGFSSKLADFSGKEEFTSCKWGANVRNSVSQQAGICCWYLRNSFSEIYSTFSQNIVSPLRWIERLIDSPNITIDDKLSC